MIATLTSANQFENVSTKDLEQVLWNALEMDDFSNEMIYGSFPNGQLGTGHTVNACNQCSSNSNSTAGCGTCCR